ncbi:MAG: hypothetical protein PHF72_03480 [Gammaproteobacteria bacterium]|nr:hypothetical protein [Gammaproteobacteria bacterium]
MDRIWKIGDLFVASLIAMAVGSLFGQWAGWIVLGLVAAVALRPGTAGRLPPWRRQTVEEEAAYMADLEEHWERDSRDRAFRSGWYSYLRDDDFNLDRD